MNRVQFGRGLILASSLVALAGTAFGQCATVSKFEGSGPATDDYFGASLAMSHGGPNNVPLVAIGMPNEDAPTAGDQAGGFSVLQKVNGWSVMQSAWNTTGEGGERLGTSIGLSDPYLIAGAPGFGSDAGRARVYTRSGGTYFFSANLTAGIGGPGDEFGASVAVSSYQGGWAVVGAPFHDFHGEVDAGAAFFYVRQTNGTWTPEYQIWGGDYGGDTQEHRGEAVAMAQQSPYAAVGAPNAENNGQPADHGVVHIVTLLANGLPGATTNVAPPTPEAGEHFGAAVAVENDLLVIGAPDEDLSLSESGFIMQRTDSGAIYVFQRNGFNWDFLGKFRSPTPTSGGRFGAKVSTDGGLQIVVAEPGTHRSYLFSSDGGAWHYQGAITDPDSPSTGEFGSAVGVRNGDIVIGDKGDDHDGVLNPGAVYTMNFEHDIPTGDTCANPMPLPSTESTGCTDFATPTGFEVVTCGNGGSGQGNDVWYVFQPDCSGNAIIDTFGSTFDTVLSVHSGCPTIFGGNAMTCNDDANFPAPNNRASLVTFNFVGGETYYVRVTGYNGAHGAYTVRPSFYYSHPNDACGNALAVGDGQHTFNTCSASETSLTTSCAGGVFKDIWFRYTAPQTGTVEMSTCGGTAVSFDTVLTVYGTNCPSGVGNELVCNDDAPGCGLQSRAQVAVVAGESYLVRLGGWGPQHYGPGTLTIETLGNSCDPDVNCDGVPDQGDVACIILAVAGDMSCYCQNDPDFNQDGVPDQGDVADLILTVAGAPCP